MTWLWCSRQSRMADSSWTCCSSMLGCAAKSKPESVATLGNRAMEMAIGMRRSTLRAISRSHKKPGYRAGSALAGRLQRAGCRADPEWSSVGDGTVVDYQKLPPANALYSDRRRVKSVWAAQCFPPYCPVFPCAPPGH